MRSSVITGLCALLMISAPVARTDPNPGEVFKEFAWGREKIQLVFGPGATAPSAPKNPRPARVPVTLDLEGATRAEVIVEFWSGHEGTSEKSIAFNGLTFRRERSVVFYPASGVKQYFNSQYGRRSTCTINWLQQLKPATAARLIFATHGPQETPGEFGLNGRQLGTVAAQPRGQGSKVYHEVDVPLDVLRTGDNEFYLLSDTKAHALEGSWPGPSLFLEIKR